MSQLLQITETAYGQMLCHVRSELPRQGCGLLTTYHSGVACRFYRIPNLVWTRADFVMDPSHLKRTEQSIWQREQSVVALCYSHLNERDYPSLRERELLFLPFRRHSRPVWCYVPHIVVVLEDPQQPVVKAYTHSEELFMTEIKLEVLAEEGLGHNQNGLGTSFLTEQQRDHN